MPRPEEDKRRTTSRRAVSKPVYSPERPTAAQTARRGGAVAPSGGREGCCNVSPKAQVTCGLAFGSCGGPLAAPLCQSVAQVGLR